MRPECEACLGRRFYQRNMDAVRMPLLDTPQGPLKIKMDSGVNDSKESRNGTNYAHGTENETV